MVSTPSAGVQMNASALNVAGEAKFQEWGAIGNDARSVAEGVGQVYQTIRNAKDYAAAADADRQMRKTAADFRDSLRTRDDEEQWGQDWSQQTQQVRDNIFQNNPNLSPKAKRAIDNNIKDWTLQSSTEFKTLANVQGINRARDQVKLSADEAAKDGDQQGVDTLLDGAVSHKLFFPEQGQELKRSYANRIQEYAAKNYIDNNPAGAVDFLSAKDDDGNYKNLPRLNQNQRDSLLREGRVRQHQWQSNNLEDVRGDVDDGNPPSDDVIKQKEDGGQISTKGAASLRRYIRQKDWAESRAEAAETMSDASSYDPTQDKDGKGYRDIMDSAAALPQKFHDRIVNTLKARVKDSDKSDDGMKTIDRLYDARVFGSWTKPSSTNPNVQVRDNALWAKANSARWDMQDALNDFRSKNPQATHDDERKFIMGRAQRYTDKRATQAVVDGILNTTK